MCWAQTSERPEDPHQPPPPLPRSLQSYPSSAWREDVLPISGTHVCLREISLRIGPCSLTPPPPSELYLDLQEKIWGFLQAFHCEVFWKTVILFVPCCTLWLLKHECTYFLHPFHSGHFFRDCWLPKGGSGMHSSHRACALAVAVSALNKLATAPGLALQAPPSSCLGTWPLPDLPSVLQVPWKPWITAEFLLNLIWW